MLFRRVWRGGEAPSHLVLSLIPIAAYLIVAIVLVWQQGPIDDAYISFRYAANLAAGHGLVFNPGQLPVEGYSSLSWVLLLTPAGLLGLDLPLVAKSLGLLFGVVTLLALMMAASLPVPSRFFAAMFLALHPAFIYHSVNGLETALMTSLVACFALSVLRPIRSRVVIALVAALLSLTRPEGFLVVVLLSAILIILERGGNWGTTRVALVSGGMASVLQVIFRLFYYGDFIANSSRAKMLPLGLALPHGLRDVAAFLTSGGGLGALPALGIAGLVLARVGRSTFNGGAFPHVGWLCSSWMLSLALLAVGGGDSFPLWRFYVPILPLLMISASEGLRVLGDRIRMIAWRRAASTAAIAGLLVGFWYRWPQHLERIRIEGAWVRHWTVVGQRLRERFPRTSSIALSPVGAISFYSGFRVIDNLGLNDRHIAGVPHDTRYYYPGHMRHDGAYVLSLRPDLVLLANGPVVSSPRSFRGEFLPPYEIGLARDQRFSADYLLEHVQVGPQRYLQVFVRSGLRS